jgi:hypothetical protein
MKQWLPYICIYLKKNSFKKIEKNATSLNRMPESIKKTATLRILSEFLIVSRLSFIKKTILLNKTIRLLVKRRPLTFICAFYAVRITACKQNYKKIKMSILLRPAFSI